MGTDGSRRAGDHQRDLHPAQQPDLEPGRPLHRGAQAFHHAALDGHRRDLALRGERHAAAASPWSSGPTRSIRRNWASRSSAMTARRSISPATPAPAALSNMRRIRNAGAFVIERYDDGDRRAHPDRRRPGRRGPPAAVAGRALARLRPPHRRAQPAVRPRPAIRRSSGRSMPISTRICRKPGRCRASIRTWAGLRTAGRSSSGPAAASAGSTPTDRARPRFRSRSTTPAS